MNRWFLKQISALNAADDYNTKKDETKDGGGNTNTAQYKLTFCFVAIRKEKCLQQQKLVRDTKCIITR